MPGPGSEWLRIEGSLYWKVLAAAFAAIALWETFRPLRKLTLPNGRRWAANAVLSAIGSFLALLIFPLTGVVLAASIGPERWGLLNHSQPPFAVRWLLGFVFLDLLRFAQHYLYHSIPVLWRVHRVHHADPDFDLTTGLRFHPGEIILSNSTYLLAIFAVAPPPEAVLAAELATVAQNFFSHANVVLPDRLELLLRRIWITPSLHRVHHSIEVREQQTNLGTIFTCWDRLAGTFLGDPPGQGKRRETGLREMQGAATYNPASLLALPFQHMPAAPAGPEILTDRPTLR